MTWDEAVAVLGAWEGRRVVVVPILEPGISLTPMQGVLSLEDPKDGVLRLRTGPDPEPYVSFFRATFISAGWVAGREGHGVSLVQGGTRVDVFLDGGRPADERAASPPGESRRGDSNPWPAHYK